MTRASDTLRIRRRARSWAAFKLDKDEAERQLAEALLLRKDQTRAELIANAREHYLAGLRKAIRIGRRERSQMSHMRRYWTTQILGWLAQARVVKHLDTSPEPGGPTP